MVQIGVKSLEKTGLLKELKAWVRNGGVLTGVSAGAIIMTKNIETAAFPSFDCDENEDNVKNLAGLQLVDFEFLVRVPTDSHSYQFPMPR